MKCKELQKGLWALVLIFTSACASTWVVLEEKEHGVIGYRNFPSVEAAHQQIGRQIPCPEGYSVLSDQFVTFSGTLYPFQSTSQMLDGSRVVSPAESHAYPGDAPTYIATTQTETRRWRELEYACKTPSTP